METIHVPLTRQPDILIACTYIPPTCQLSPRSTLVIFLNGMDCPQKNWYPTIEHAINLRNKDGRNSTPMLTFDRPGQGKTTGRNKDKEGRPKGHGNDCLDAAHDVREVIKAVAISKLGIDEQDLQTLDLVIVAHSMGCAIARLYAALYPVSIAGLIFIESTWANSDTISVFPDPTAPQFSKTSLPTRVTAEMCQRSRAMFGAVYAPGALNREGLWRGNLAQYLPETSKPNIPGNPWITVIVSDLDALVHLQGENGLPEVMLREYLYPFSYQYSMELSKLTRRERSKGPLIELVEMLEKLRRNGTSRM